MNFHAVLRRAARIEYALLRTPLAVVDERVVARLFNEDSTTRQSFERALDALDHAARRWLGDPGLAPEQPGDESAEQTAEQASPAEEGQAAEGGSTTSHDEVEELAEELIEHEQFETFAGELAEQDDLRRVQAELDAKRLLAEQQEHQAQLDDAAKRER